MTELTKELITIRDFIRYGVTRFNKEGVSCSHGMQSVFDEASYLVLETLALPPDEVDFFIDARMTEKERKELIDIFDKRIKTRKPAPYLTNKSYIGDFSFYVDENVPIPNSFLGEFIYSEITSGKKGKLIDDPRSVETVLDLCTGSGCLAIMAAHLFSEAKIDAVDISEGALNVAKRNIEESNLEDRITLYEGNLFAPVRGKKYDLIIANPPCVPKNLMESLAPEHRHEPKQALYGGADGLDFVRRILKRASEFLSENGAFMCEISCGREKLEAEYPHIRFSWIDSDNNEEDKILWLTYDELLF